MKLNKLESLTNAIVDDLSPVTPVPDRRKLLLLWTMITVIFVPLSIILSGPLRHGYVDQISNHPLFLLEVISAFLISPLAAFLAMKLMVPGELPNNSRRVLIPVGLLLLYFGWLVMRIFNPSIPPSSEGSRPHCSLEIFAFSLLPMISLLYFLSKGAVMRPKITGILVGIAGTIPSAAFMYISCRYDPTHIILFHFFPVLMMAIGGRFYLTWCHRSR